MNRIFVTGDTHGSIDIKKLSNKQWPLGKTLDNYDYLIILGDFGLLWDITWTAEETYWRKFLDNRKYTVLFVDGNHENHARLDNLETTQFLGGKVGVVSDNIFHLRRGEIYTIANKTIFTFGGAASYDKQYRTENVSWWARELPSREEEERALDNLERAQHKVDYILTHTLPEFVVGDIVRQSFARPQDLDPTRKFLQHIVENT